LDRGADVLVHVVDAAHHDWEEQAAVVGEVLHEAGVDAGAKVVVALNKADRLDEAERRAVLKTARERGWEVIGVSALRGTGIEELRCAVARARTAQAAGGGVR
jgi:GTP-binding protein HflX